MPTATITPKFINGPKAESSYGSLNVDGVYYSFDVRKIPPNQFIKGQPVTVEFTTKTQGDKTYYNIQSVIPATNGGLSKDREHAESRDDAKSMLITRLAVAKSCIEGGRSMDEADLWLAWVNNDLPPAN